MSWLLPWNWKMPNAGDRGVDTDSRARSTPPRPVPRTLRDPSEFIKGRQLVPEPPRYVRSPSPPATPVEPKIIKPRHLETHDSPSSSTFSPVIHTRRRRGPPSSPTPPRNQQSVSAGPTHRSTSLEPSKPNIGVNAFEAALKSRIVKGLAEGVVLQEHQHIARAFMASCEKGMFKGGQLWDDMGLGKTLEIICRILDSKMYQEEKGTTCIVAPCSIMYQWKAEIRKFAPSLRVLLHWGSDRTRDSRVFNSYDIVIVSYNTLLSEWKSQESKKSALMDAIFLRVVLDEGHRIANMENKTTEACMALIALYRWVVTGTPIQKSHKDMFSYHLFLRVMDPDDFPFFDANRSLLYSFKTPFTLGRKKGDLVNGKAIVELPSRTLEIIEVHVNDQDEARFIEGFETKEVVTRNNKFIDGRYHKDGEDGPLDGFTWTVRQQQVACIPDLATTSVKPKKRDGANSCQLCEDSLADTMRNKICTDCKTGIHPENDEAEDPLDPDVRPQSSKVRAILDVLAKVHSEEDMPKIVIYSTWTSAFDILQPYLIRQGYQYVRYDGKTSQMQRLRVLQSLKDNDNVTIALVSLKAGGAGLNLNFCSHAMMFNPWWNPSVEDQAFDRLHRIGQDREVKLYKFIVPDTIETRIVKKQNKLRALQQTVWKIGGPIDGTQSTSLDVTLQKRLTEWKRKRPT